MVALRGRGLHGLRAAPHHAQPVLEGHRAREHQRGVPAEAQPGGARARSHSLRRLGSELLHGGETATKSAGCANAVSSSFSFGPFTQTSSRSYPRISLALSHIERTEGSSAAADASMPTSASPAPGTEKQPPKTPLSAAGAGVVGVVAGVVAASSSSDTVSAPMGSASPGFCALLVPRGDLGGDRRVPRGFALTLPLALLGGVLGAAPPLGVVGLVVAGPAVHRLGLVVVQRPPVPDVRVQFGLLGNVRVFLLEKTRRASGRP